MHGLGLVTHDDARATAERYRPDIDGLRAVSVLLVLAFHLDLPVVSGGFIGVDVFFVISGFLMTRIIADGVLTDSFSFAGFYARRCRRILPALLVMLAVTLVFGWKLLGADDYKAMGDSAVAAAFSWSNLFFYWNTGYFDGPAALMPLRHTWSLAVEEQFYFVWPALLVLAWVALRRSRRGLAAVVTVVAIAGLPVSVWAVQNDPKAAFYLLHARLWELAAGGVLVFVTAPRWLQPIATPVGLAVIAASALLLTTASSFPGLNALPPVIGAMLIIGADPKNPSNRLLGATPIRLIGLMSYSIYLWHWPIIVYFKEYNNSELPASATVAIAIASIVIGGLSWRFVEQPFRRRRTAPLRVISVSLVAAALVAAMGWSIAAKQGVPSRDPYVANLGDRMAMWNYQCPHFALGLNLSCAVGADWNVAPARGLLWGDSNALHLLPYLHEAGKRTDRSIALFFGCSAPFGERVHDTANPWSEPTRCKTDRVAGLRLIRENPEIEFVILSSLWSSYLDRLQATDEPTSIAHGLDLMREEMRPAVEEITALGRKVVLISDIPTFETEPVACAAVTFTRLWRNAGTVCKMPVTSIPKENVRTQTEITRLFDQLAANSRDVFSLSLSAALCKTGDCLTYLDEQFLYRDRRHLRRDFPAALNARLASILGFDDLLPRLGGNAARLSGIPVDICSHPPATSVWRPTTPLQKGDGYSYLWNLPELAAPSGATAGSQLILCEGDRLLGPPRTALPDIVKTGAGRYLQSGHGVSLSTSDNSDPNTNGRSYSAFVFQPKRVGGN